MATVTNSEAFQKFLDEQQYSMNSILRYERIFGRTFVSTGGKQTTDMFLKPLNLKADDYVLDVGCGIGGSAFLMEKDYGAKVRGVDLSTNMIELAQRRKEEVHSIKTSFHIEDITTAQYDADEYDVIYSRDTLLHIKDKETLFRNFYKWLKPGGRLFITDYSCRAGEHTEEFTEYVIQRGYNLLTRDQYEQLTKKSGFTNVQVHNRSDEFVTILERERDATIKIKDDYIKEFSEKDYEEIVNGWTDKIRRVREGSQTWVSIYAVKSK